MTFTLPDLPEGWKWGPLNPVSPNSQQRYEFAIRANGPGGSLEGRLSITLNDTPEAVEELFQSTCKEIVLAIESMPAPRKEIVETITNIYAVFNSGGK